ncbi:MAG TPA: NADH dehydrogenase ubiquinone Fe-S protein 4 [Sphingomonas sp.]|jgi:hypothetical protein|uniref:NADH dehydrogenase ubiquinone Fe-S protein 4 n=1 Tax=Sphingomonas sp. TaxID=28214 RepID=UPI002ED93C42
MTHAYLYQQPKNGQQGGRARGQQWVLDFRSDRAQRPDPLTGWTGGAETQSQIDMLFPTLDSAIAHCEREGIAYTVAPPNRTKLKIQSYAENFR